MDVIGLWEDRIPKWNDDAMVRNHRFEHVVTISLGLSIGAEGMQVLLRERTNANSEQLKLYQISCGAAFHGLLDEFGYVPQTAWFHLTFDFASPPIRSISYLSRAVRYCTDGLCGAALQYRFCNTAWLEMSIRVIDCLVAEFAERE